VRRRGLSGTTIAIDNTADSPAYPDVAGIARRHGITHALSTGLPVQRRTIGALNIYGTDEAAYNDTTRELAAAFASYAAVALANADLYTSTANLAANPQRALDSRAVIDQAKGILMRQHRISPDVAFDLLVQLSNTANRKLREIAQDVVDETQRTPPA
jgi:GAF domain-containing protein